MNKKFRLKKGDNVVVLSGESKGLRGRILEMDYKNDTAIVEGVNLMSKHTRPNAKDPKGGIIKKEAAIRICKLMYVGSTKGVSAPFPRPITNPKEPIVEKRS